MYCDPVRINETYERGARSVSRVDDGSFFNNTHPNGCVILIVIFRLTRGIRGVNSAMDIFFFAYIAKNSPDNSCRRGGKIAEKLIDVSAGKR